MQSKKRGANNGLIAYKEDGSSFLFPITFVKLYKLDSSVFTNDEIINSYIEKYAFFYSTNILARREHSKLEIKQKLLLKNIDIKIINKTIDKLISYNYLSEKRFVESFIRSKKNKSKKEIIYLLKTKGIEVSNYYNLLNDINEKEKCEILVKKLLKKNKTEEQIIRSLLNKGFNYYDIKSFL